MIIIILIILLIFLLVIPFYAIHCEKKDFNNGICPRCGRRLYHFDTNSQVSRGYCCHKCPYFTWISWYWVDRKFLHKK